MSGYMERRRWLLLILLCFTTWSSFDRSIHNKHCSGTWFVTADDMEDCIEDYSPILDPLEPPPPTPPELLAKIDHYRQQPSHSNRYIIAQCDGGFSNRIRTLLAYRLLARFIFNYAKLIFVWDVNEACPGHFLDLFEPIVNVTFTTSGDLPRYKQQPQSAASRIDILERFPNDRNTFEGILYNHDLHYIVGDVVWGSLRLLLLRDLRPVPSLYKEILSFVRKYDICHQAAMHIRKTDLECILKPKQRMSIDSFLHFADKQLTLSHSLTPQSNRSTDEANAPNQNHQRHHHHHHHRHQHHHDKIFLLTDDPSTQQFFLKRYNTDRDGERIIVFDTIPMTALTNSTAEQFRQDRQDSDTHITGNSSVIHQCQIFPLLEKQGKQGPTNMTERRHTSLRHTVADIFIAAHAAKFKPTPMSSVGQLIQSLKWVERYKHCSCFTASDNSVVC